VLFAAAYANAVLAGPPAVTTHDATATATATVTPPQEAAWVRHLADQGIASIANGLLFAKLVATGSDEAEEPPGHVVSIGELPVGKSWSAVNAEAYWEITEALSADHEANAKHQARN